MMSKGLLVTSKICSISKEKDVGSKQIREEDLQDDGGDTA